MIKRWIGIVLVVSMLTCSFNLGITFAEDENLSQPAIESSAEPELSNELNIENEETPVPEEVPSPAVQPPIEENGEQAATEAPQETAVHITSRPVDINVITQSGAPIENAQVMIRDSAAFSGDDGVAHFDSLPCEANYVKAYAAGYRYKATAIRIPSNSSETYSFSVILLTDDNPVSLFSYPNYDDLSPEGQKCVDRFNQFAGISGYNFNYSSYVQDYTALGTPIAEHNGYIYCFTSSATHIYNVAGDCWEPSATAIPLPRDEAGVAAVGDDIYVIGGQPSDGDDGKAVQVFNTSTKTWRKAADLPQTGAYFDAHTINGEIYIGGGVESGDARGYKPEDSSGQVNLTKYTPATNTWTVLDDDVNLRGASSTVYNNKIYFTGFMSWYDYSSNNVKVYDIDSGTWSNGQSRSSGNSDGMGVFGGQFLTMGEYLFWQGGNSWDDPEDENNEYPYTVEDFTAFYIPATDEWVEFYYPEDTSDGGSLKLNLREYQSVVVYDSSKICFLKNNNQSFAVVTVDILDKTAVITCHSELAAGSKHILKIKDGNVYARGDNTYGQLGIAGVSSTDGFVLVPQLENKDVIKVEAGLNTSYALTSDGNIYAWGDNSLGQVGQNIGSRTSTPTQILVNMADVAAGDNHAIGLEKNGTVWVWGSNDCGQLGTGTAGGYVSERVDIYFNAKTIGAGGSHSFYVDKNSGLYAAGKNSSGQLGLGNTTNQASFSYVMGNIRKATGGAEHSVILDNDGTAYTCGSNKALQLGNTAGNINHASTPAGIGLVDDIWAGASSTAYLKDGKLYQCGAGIYNTTGGNFFVQITGIEYPIGVEIGKVLCFNSRRLASSLGAYV